MAIRHQLIQRSPAEVWAVLADPEQYGDWVVGPDKSEPLDQAWPRTGSRLRFTLRVGPWAGQGTTTVRHSEACEELELEAGFKALGSARIYLQLRPWGEGTLVICDEHPLRGVGGTLHNPVSEALLQLRHRGMLARLAKVVERDAAGARHA
ncbi:SRPBCC family protein [Streptomyces sp. SDr-06]|uniref:SRPBCC family protein n=1 Tax=Streptomyces sp. SDr-06 TaxID=2267702 RepID=UPI000DEBDC2B|nr:SRPBCC family protein [Streptomyces sp. SDr-06]RCH67742.1 SRPBCC family protein [Streptomyces sp. SDr-06]